MLTSADCRQFTRLSVGSDGQQGFVSSSCARCDTGSNDGAAWTTLRRHDDDGTIDSGFFVGHWPVEEVTIAYRHFYVHQHGQSDGNDGGDAHELVRSGIELYGKLVEA